MSLETMAEFWMGLRRLTRCPTRPDDWVNARPSSGEFIDINSATPSLLLDRRTVSDYSDSDFEHLSPEERILLARLVIEFETAVRASDIDPSTRRRRASDALAQIIRLLEFSRFYDPLAFVLGKQIEKRIQPHRPAELLWLKFMTGLDSDDEPVLRIWGMLDEPGEKRFAQLANQLRELVFWAALAVDRRRFPHIRFRRATDTSSGERIPGDELVEAR